MDAIQYRDGGYDISVGISGWEYGHWRGDFYPRDLVARRWLSFAAARFETIEINGSFYSLQRPATYQRWREETPDGFVFAVKGSRFVTHMKRLRNVERGLANFFASGPLALEEKLGPMLWQLPASFAFDAEVMRNFLDLLPDDTAAASDLAHRHDDKLKARGYLTSRIHRRIRHAIEPRHRSFDVPQFYELLESRDVACAVSDSPTWPQFERQTASFAYVRLHGHSDLYASRYSEPSLEGWASRCRTWAGAGDREVFVYFDNDARGHAPHDAGRFRTLVGQTLN